VRVTQVCLVRVTFDHYAVRLVILTNRIILRHPVTPNYGRRSIKQKVSTLWTKLPTALKEY